MRGPAKSEKLGLRPHAPVGAALAVFAHDILGEARGAIDNPDHTDAVAVHDFRKAMKRWRALLRLFEPMVGAEARALRDEARDLARELAAARDSQSALDAVNDLAGTESAFSERSWTTIRGRLDALRENAEAVALTEATRERLRAALDAGAAAIEHWPLEPVDFWQVADGLEQSYARVRAAIPATWADAGDEDLHLLRQRVVIHRYQMPLADPLWPRLGRLWIGEAQRLRERLGAHQDLAVLAGLAAPRQALAPWRSRLLPLIDARKSAHVAAAARLAGRLFAERPKAFRRRLIALWEGVDDAA